MISTAMHAQQAPMQIKLDQPSASCALLATIPLLQEQVHAQVALLACTRIQQALFHQPLARHVHQERSAKQEAVFVLHVLLVHMVSTAVLPSVHFAQVAHTRQTLPPIPALFARSVHQGPTAPLEAQHVCRVLLDHTV